MAGMFNNDFSWDSGKIFDSIGNPEEGRIFSRP